MPRKKNTRSTTIYWLQDIRPEILVEWPQGLPFYCGKTVERPKDRLKDHLASPRRWPNRKTSKRILECRGHVRIVALEIIPPDGDWVARERHWIAVSRRLFPETMTNASDGGEGPAGLIHSPETREKMGASKRGKMLSPEHRAKLSAAKQGRTLSPEARAHLSAYHKGKAKSAETRAKMSIVAKNRPPEVYAKLQDSRRAKKAGRLAHFPL